MKPFILIIFITLVQYSFSQDVTLGFPIKDSTLMSIDTTARLDFESETKGTLTIVKDKRLDDITEFIGRERESIKGTLIDGYRIQIFFNESRNIAQSQKAGFLNSHSNHKAYIDYLAPNYRIRVGNFRTKLQAERFKQELISVYPTCIVLKDKIELPVLKEESDNL